MNIVYANPALIADKAALRKILDEQDRVTGYVPNPLATSKRSRERMLACGIIPEDNQFSCELIRMREGG